VGSLALCSRLIVSYVALISSLTRCSFNQRRDDFGSDREYDDYLEEVEDLST